MGNATTQSGNIVCSETLQRVRLTGIGEAVGCGQVVVRLDKQLCRVFFGIVQEPRSKTRSK
jgi:hypothetical protein